MTETEERSVVKWSINILTIYTTTDRDELAAPR